MPELRRVDGPGLVSEHFKLCHVAVAVLGISTCYNMSLLKGWMLLDALSKLTKIRK